MDLNKLTLGEIKELKNLLGVTSEKKCEKIDYGWQIVILQRGWVMVGRLFKDGEDCSLEDAAVIRVWGTTKGLGELAKNGPLDGTKLDPCHNTVRFNYYTLVAMLETLEEKWCKK